MARKDPQIDLFGGSLPGPAPEPARSSPAAGAIPAARPLALAEQVEVAEPAGAAVLSVSELTAQLKGALEGRFSRVAVLGEVSNCRRQSSGHIYFTLKDEGACVAAVVWRREAARLPFEVRDGLQLVCQGRIEIYGPHGKYQLIVDRLEPVGDGALALAFADLKRKLEGEGLFEVSRKRKLPFLPRCIGVVTSPTGAALRDFLRVLHLRFPGLPVLIASARVQGQGAAAEIQAGLELLARSGRVDVVVLTRGGGSMEDLWAFNDERLARAIAASPVPVVSAIGHEIDFTIADFVADRRAPTPPGAAALIAPGRRALRAGLSVASERVAGGHLATAQRQRQRVLQLRLRLSDPRRAMTERRLGLGALEERLSSAAQAALGARQQRLKQLAERLQRRSPHETLGQRLRELHELRVRLERAGGKALAVAQRRERLAQLRTRLQREVESRVRKARERLSVGEARLEAISPQRVFERGYSMTRATLGGEVVRRAAQVKSGDRVEITLGLREDRGELEEERITAKVE